MVHQVKLFINVVVISADCHISRITCLYNNFNLIYFVYTVLTKHFITLYSIRVHNLFMLY